MALFELLHADIVQSMLQPDCSEEEFERRQQRVEKMGFDVGGKMVSRAMREKPRFTRELEKVKFVCTDFWQLLFRKKVNKLQTNHRGTYVLHDDSFEWVRRLSGEDGGERFLTFACGLVRGALGALGLTVVVTPTITTLPTCTFQCKIVS
tara:strand:+ start:134 stop:583 length:450 start_codon:yes stop_codon:yes gene_type:complete